MGQLASHHPILCPLSDVFVQSQTPSCTTRSRRSSSSVRLPFALGVYRLRAPAHHSTCLSDISATVSYANGNTRQEGTTRTEEELPFFNDLLMTPLVKEGMATADQDILMSFAFDVSDRPEPFRSFRRPERASPDPFSACLRRPLTTVRS